MLAWFTAAAFAAPLLPGDEAPPLDGIAWVHAPEGVTAPTSWADLSGKVVVIDFWATWCGPCVASWPEVERLARSVGDDVVVLAVSSEAAPRVKGFLDHRAGTVPQLVGAESAAMNDAWSIGSLPTYGVVSPEGKVFAIVDNVPTKELLEAARSGIAPEAIRADSRVAAQTFGPSEGSARRSFSSNGGDFIWAYAVDSASLLEMSSGFVSRARHRYDAPIPEGLWDIDVAAPANQDIDAIARARIGEACGSRSCWAFRS